MGRGAVLTVRHLRQKLRSRSIGMVQERRSSAMGSMNSRLIRRPAAWHRACHRPSRGRAIVNLPERSTPRPTPSERPVGHARLAVGIDDVRLNETGPTEFPIATGRRQAARPDLSSTAGRDMPASSACAGRRRSTDSNTFRRVGEGRESTAAASKQAFRAADYFALPV